MCLLSRKYTGNGANDIQCWDIQKQIYSTDVSNMSISVRSHMQYYIHSSIAGHLWTVGHLGVHTPRRRVELSGCSSRAVISV